MVAVVGWAGLRQRGNLAAVLALKINARTSQIATCLNASETYLLNSAEAQAIIDEQIRNQWDEAADAARLTEADRRLLYGREILNEYIFRS
jgi:serine/threonine-protein kinase HipA